MLDKTKEIHNALIGFDDFWFKIIGIILLRFFIPLAFFNAQVNPFFDFL